MNTLFEDLATGLDEIQAFLAGEREGYKVHKPADKDVSEALAQEPGAE